VTINKCGFCKGDAYLSSYEYSVGPVMWKVKCHCGASGTVEYTEDNAIKSWNRIRVDTREDVLDALIDRQNDFRTDKGV